jgi:hypothetical protein
MISNEEINYISNFLLKSGERLDFPIEEYSNDSVIEVKIIRQTERTYRVVALLTLANGDKPKESLIDDELLKLGLTPKKKININEHEQNTINWFNQGYILKEIRLKKDGRTQEAQHFRMGYRLYKYLQDQTLSKEIELDMEFSSWKENTLDLVETFKTTVSEKQVKRYQSYLSKITDVSLLYTSELKEATDFPTVWSVSKRHKFLYFITAFLKMSIHKNEFDWKEIGANYYKEIGGSKEFDRFKDDFINLLEEWAQCPAALLGLTSLGKITPFYFSGSIIGRFSNYRYGPVHSLTDLSIAEEEYTTTSKMLWIVENRAILTRMAAENNFIEKSESLVLCIDGHLRSSHKNGIQQLLKFGEIQQVLIWTDYDPDGFLLSKEVYQTVIEKYNGIIKWITHTKGILENFVDYEVYMQDLLKEKRMEQEQVLGGADQWRKWINH